MSRADKKLWRSLLVCGVILVEVELLVLTSSALAHAAEPGAPQAKADVAETQTAGRNEIDLLDQMMQPTPAPDGAAQPEAGLEPIPQSGISTQRVQPPPGNAPAPFRYQAGTNSPYPPNPSSNRPANVAQIKIFTLKDADATDMAELLRTLFNNEGAMRFAADRRTNSVVVIARREQVVQVETVVSQIDLAPTRPPVKSFAKETAVRPKEGVPAGDVRAGEKSLQSGNLQVQKLPDRVMIRSADGNLQLEDVTKILSDLRANEPAAKDAAAAVPDGLVATIRRQQQELKELRALVESLHPGSEKRVERVEKEKVIEQIRPTEERIK